MNSHDRFDTINALDLDPIKVKLMHQESGEGWSLEKANAVELEYRRYLMLMLKFPNEEAAPLVDVDTFWHYHILDTMKYAADCDAVFGYFLHHFPYVGLRGEADEEAHQRMGSRMKELYEETFGVAYVRGAAHGDHKQAAWSARVAQQDATGQTAWSARVAQQDATKQTAWSARVAQQDATGHTAWSARVAQQDATKQTAWSARVAQEDAAGQTAWSARVAQASKEKAEKRSRFYSERPALPLA
ncbi:hypothetical protein [Janthinobacterium agaricidamnosum]|uniref:Glycine-rich domain-containing protein-like n=1 Tax=Janthinobacterium agaricidamnosum NBRC 102515 = DSM 9628 TaxID=1349767 RepID=W0VA89_9BURK|nr:hypothetical protein [Janthinobacterium agaricidamnosum]CDG84806.1 putative uncharacterized protein [Janthinobacterium agaricidamnosum NBRC 102515 = DSM 9628]